MAEPASTAVGGIALYKLGLPGLFGADHRGRPDSNWWRLISDKISGQADCLLMADSVEKVGIVSIRIGSDISSRA